MFLLQEHEKDTLVTRRLDSSPSFLEHPISSNDQSVPLQAIEHDEHPPTGNGDAQQTQSRAVLPSNENDQSGSCFVGIVPGLYQSNQSGLVPEMYMSLERTRARYVQGANFSEKEGNKSLIVILRHIKTN